MTRYKREDIPQEYFSWNNKYNKFAAKWFYEGINKNELTPKENTHLLPSMYEIHNVLSDWNYEHNLKLAIAAYLLNKYFDVVDAVPPAENKKHKRPKQEINYCNNSRLGHGKNLQLPSLKQQLTDLLWIFNH